jgi:hypothetical protein
LTPVSSKKTDCDPDSDADPDRRRGHHMLSHLRTELYSGYSRPIYPGGAEALPHNIEENNRLIEKAKAGGPPPRRE